MTLPKELMKISQQPEGIEDFNQLKQLFGPPFEEIPITFKINGYSGMETQFLIKSVKTLRDFNCKKINWRWENWLISAYVWNNDVLSYFIFPINQIGKPSTEEIEGHS